MPSLSKTHEFAPKSTLRWLEKSFFSPVTRKSWTTKWGPGGGASSENWNFSSEGTKIWPRACSTLHLARLSELPAHCRRPSQVLNAPPESQPTTEEGGGTSVFLSVYSLYAEMRNLGNSLAVAHRIWHIIVAYLAIDNSWGHLTVFILNSGGTWFGCSCRIMSGVESLHKILFRNDWNSLSFTR